MERPKDKSISNSADRASLVEKRGESPMKLKIVCVAIAILFILMMGTAGASVRSERVIHGSTRYNREVSGMLSELGKRLKGRAPEEKLREKFSSLNGKERALILSLYKQMKRTESGPGREIAVSLIMALLVLS